MTKRSIKKNIKAGGGIKLRSLPQLGLWPLGIMAGVILWIVLTPKGELDDWAGQWTMEHSSPVFQYSVRFQPQGKNLKFQMEAYSGTHMGSIEGIAELKNPNQAVWQENHQDEKPPFLSEVVFIKEGDKISVSAKNTEYYGGAGIHFDEGIYFRGLAKDDPYPLVSHNLLTREEEDRVRTLTGEDYPLVVTCLELARADEVKEKGFKGKVVDGFVRGAAPYMNARITIETDGVITVGVTDCEKEQIRIHTTRPDGKTPTPFDSWETANFPVIYVQSTTR